MGFFDRLFPKRQNKNLTYMQMMNGYVPSFTKWDSKSYESDVVRACIHAIASNGAKLKGRHVRYENGKLKDANSNLNYLLQYQPNPLMNAFDFLYKVISEYHDPDSANALVYIDKDDDGIIKGFYPLSYLMAEFLEDQSGNIYVQYQFANGKKVVVPYESVIHLRKFYKDDELFGSPATNVLHPTMQLIRTTDEGIINAVKQSAYIRGVLKYQGILKPEDIERDRNRFVKEYLSTSNMGGIAAIDSKAEFQTIDLKPQMVDAEQMKLIEQKVYKFFNLNEAIVMSKYTEDEWNAFYESVIEPLAVQMSLEFTNKCFTPRERGFGNQIVFESNRLQYVSVKTKVELIKETAPFAIFTRNEIREIFNLPPVEGGDTFVLAVGGEAELLDGKEGENDDREAAETNERTSLDDGNTSGRNGE